jgi:endonuclease/exonuclease/phosphatase family metal-dependent hydrolase
MVERLRELIAAGSVIGALGGGIVLIGPEISTVDSIRVAAFNVRVFGQSKLSQPEVMQVLADVAREFDVIAIQEVRDVSLETPEIFLDLINDESDLSYRAVVGPRLGRSNSKEQYVVYYVHSRVELVHAYTYPDPEDVFEREPLVTSFRAGGFDFTLVTCHVKPSDAERELEALAEAAGEIRAANPGEVDLLLMGDFNADGDYLDESELANIFPAPGFRSVIGNEEDTMTTSDNTYDRIILSDGVTELAEGTAQVYRFDVELALDDQELVQRVSDHYPVHATFSAEGEDDDDGE